MASYLFGSGKLLFKAPDNQVYQVGILQDVSINFESSTKDLVGNKQYPIATVHTAKKVTGKATSAIIDGRLMSTIMSGTVTAGRVIIGENVVTGASATVSPSGTGFVADLGVIDASGNGMFLTGAAPALGAYSQSSGTYTFNASEPDSKTISYSYNTGSGQTLSVNNNLMGLQTNYSCFLQEQFNGETFGLELLSVIIPSMDMAFKNEDFAVTNLNFSAQAKADGSVFKIYTE
jgi:hypothetical protein